MVKTTSKITAAKSSGSPAWRSSRESLRGCACCSMKLSPGAVPFGPMSVEVVAPAGEIVVSVVSTL